MATAWRKHAAASWNCRFVARSMPSRLSSVAESVVLSMVPPVAMRTLPLLLVDRYLGLPPIAARIDDRLHALDVSRQRGMNAQDIGRNQESKRILRTSVVVGRAEVRWQVPKQLVVQGQ